MLLLSRKVDERIFITLPNGDEIVVTVTDIRSGRGGAVKLGFEAPDHIKIHRSELIQTAWGDMPLGEPSRDAGHG